MVENRAGRHQVARDLRSARGIVAASRRIASSKGWSIPQDLQRLKQRLSQEYADIVYNGLWFSPTRSAIDAFMQNIQQRVTGTIRLKLFKGDCRVVGRKSPFALYDQRPRDLRRRATRSITRPRKASSRSGACPWKRRRKTRAARSATAPGSGGEVADGESLVRTFQRRARSRRVSVRVVLSLRQAAVRRRRRRAAWRGSRGSPVSACSTRRKRRRSRRRCNDILERGRREPAFVDGPDEDVHAFVERQLVERVGDLGKRLHTGRSRNEQVSLDLRLYLRRQHAAAAEARLLRLSARLRGRPNRPDTAVMPSYTHLRRAMPVLVAHFFLAHVAALRRDYDRFGWASQEADAMPLGSGAVAGHQLRHGHGDARLASGFFARGRPTASTRRPIATSSRRFCTPAR